MAIDTPNSYNHKLLIIVACGIFICAYKIQAAPQHFAYINAVKTTPGMTTKISRQDILSINAVGDIMLGGTSEPVLQENSYNYPFDQVKNLFKGSDIVIGNLEGPLTNSDTPYTDKAYLFKTPPELVAPALKQAGFNILNLANNHIMDFGIEGLKDTIHALETNHIQYVGADLNLQQARAGKIIHTRGHKIGFLSYSLTFPKSFWANTNTPGTAFGHEHQIREDIRRMRQLTDIVIVSFHWGQERCNELREYQPILAHAAIDEGAAMVIGHHPHVLQAVEHYKKGIILYSLGNFTFGSYSRSAESSVVATAEFKNNEFYSLRLTPINVLNIEVNFQPQILQHEPADLVIEEINRLSSPYHTRFENEHGVAILHTYPTSNQ